MSEPHVAAPAASVNPAEQYHFWLRRLHSLAGVIPLGVFLILHLTTNASILGGAAAFDQNVARIHSLGPFLVPVEIVGIFIPLAFHIIVGVLILRTAKYNVGVYKYTANRRYTWQRITGVLAALFILYHLYHMHWIGKPLSFMGGARFDPHNASQSAATAIQAHVLIAPIYAAGVLSTVYHFANGLWTFLITWGITVGRRSQKVAGRVCLVVGILLALVGLGAVSGFRTFKTTESESATAAPHAQSPHRGGSDAHGT